MFSRIGRTRFCPGAAEFRFLAACEKKRGGKEYTVQYSTIQYSTVHRLWEMERMTGHKKPCVSRPQFNTFIDNN